jgi:GT2 family glycosyltransferase
MPSNRDHDPTVSIIVPTFNRCSRLERLLRSLEQTYGAGGHFEVVVAVDGATDGTIEMLSTIRTVYPLRVLTQPNRGPAAARNAAMGVASGDVLIFLDDDVVPVQGLIDSHLGIHREDPAGVAIGPMLAPAGRTMTPWLRWEAAMLQKQYEAMLAGHWGPSPRQFYTANASVRREYALAVGGFDESFTRAEDVEFAYRLADQGMRFYFVSAAAVLHEPDRTFESWLCVPYEYGRYDVLMTRDRGRDHVRLAYQHWYERHPLNRLLPRWCVGHHRRLGAAVAALTLALRYDGPGASDRVQMALCSALFNLQYWQGLADATGLGASIWEGLRDRSLVVPKRPAGVDAPTPTG